MAFRYTLDVPFKVLICVLLREIFENLFVFKRKSKYFLLIEMISFG